MHPFRAALAAVLASIVSVHAQPLDHLTCHKVKDPLARATRAVDVAAAEPALAAVGCVVRVPARLVCSGARPFPGLGGAEGAAAPAVLCYKLKCPRGSTPLPVADGLGSRIVQVKGASLLCLPLAGPATTTTTAAPTTTTSTSEPPAPTTSTTAAEVATTTTTTLVVATGCVVVNEVQTGGATAADEFVEVLNRCAHPAALAGARLVYRAATGTADVLLFTWAADAALGPGARAVLGGTGFAGARDGTLAGAGLAAGGGAVGIRDATGALLDGVGWGAAVNLLVEGSAGAAPPAGSALARRPDGADTDQNAVDLSIGAPTPGAANPG